MTGAAGFIGSRVVRALLEQGYEVHAAVRSEPGPRLRGLADVRLERCELTRPDEVARLVERVCPRVCIHCAWIATPGEYLTSTKNALHPVAAEALGTALVLAGCERLVALGTCFEYAPSDKAHSESSPLGPATPYARAKVEARERLERVCSGTAMTLAWARLFHLFGPGEDPRRLVAAVTLALLNGRPAPTTSGEQVRDFLHVDDVARALLAIAQSEVSGPVNVASGRRRHVRDLVLALGRLTGRGDLIELGALPYADDDPMVVAADVDRLASTGFAPRYDLEEGLERTVAWWSGQGRRS